MAKQTNKQDKRLLSSAMVTTRLSGTIKNKFFDDIERQGTKEGKLAREIIRKYYADKNQS